MKLDRPDNLKKNRDWTGSVCQALYICIENKNRYSQGHKEGVGYNTKTMKVGILVEQL